MTNAIPAMTTVLRRGLLTTARSCSSASKPWVARGVTNSSPNATATTTATRQLQLQIPLLRTRGLGALNASQVQTRNLASRRSKKSTPENDEGDGATEEKETKKKRHDPAGFAKRVTALLAKGNYPRAYALVVNAEKARLDCMVAWNMLLDWKMRNGETQEAFKLFNDMKKRGRKPNAQTFTVMLRGCAKSRSGKAVKIALTVYRSIFAHNSPIKPSTIHHNAMLEACARHNDMEAFWNVVGQLPEEGYGAPDNITFTIILNAIRANTQDEIKKLHGVEDAKLIREKRIEAVKEGKRIWADVIQQWRLGFFMIDTKLISSMGRLLLFGGREQDLLDIFSLFLQTMAIPRCGPRQTQAQADALNRKKNNHAPPRKKDPDSPENEDPEKEMSEAEEFRDLFEPVKLAKIRENMEARTGGEIPKIQYPLPSNAELSLLMETCSLLKNGYPIFRKYWAKLTDKKGDFVVKPDAESYHTYLRILRGTRSSAETVRLICEEMGPQKMAVRKTFIIAMSTCARDRLNPNILDTAGQLAELMGKTLHMPEPRVLMKYMKLVRKVTEANLAKPDADPKSKFERIVSELSSALSVLKPMMRKLERVVEEDAITGYLPPRRKVDERRRDEEEEEQDDEEYDEEEDEMPARNRRGSTLSTSDDIDTRDANALLQTYHLLIQKIFAPGLAPWAPEETTKIWDEEDKRVHEFMAKFQATAQKNKAIDDTADTKEAPTESKPASE